MAGSVAAVAYDFVRFVRCPHILMRRHKFDGDRDKGHVVYTHSTHSDIITNVAKPHGGTKHVKQIYVEKALDAIDRKNARG
jgi:hypothetical protein